MKCRHHENVTPIAQILQAMQGELGITNAKLCEKANIEESYYSRLINGKNVRPGREKITALGFGLIALDIKPNGKERNPVWNPKDRMNTLLAAEDMSPLTGDSADEFALAVLSCLERRQYSLADVNACVKQQNFLIKPTKNKRFSAVLTALQNEIKIKPAALYRAATITAYEYHRITVNKYSFNNPHICKKAQVFLLGFALTSLDTRALSQAERKQQARKRIDALLTAAGYCPLDTSTAPLNAHISYCIEQDIYDIDAVSAYLAEQGAETLSVSLDSADAYFDRGIRYGKKKDLDQAIHNFSAAIRIDANLFEAYYYRGLVYTEKSGCTAKAIQDFTAVIRIVPEYAEAYYLRGALYAEKGDNDQALRDYTEAIRRYPDRAKAYMKQAEEYAKKGGDERFKAIRQYSMAKDLLHEKCAEAYYQRGLMYAEEGLDDLALHDFNSAISLNSKYATVYYDLDTG